MRDLKVGYVTHGTPNAAKDNVILLVPGSANTRHSADGYIGPGNALDPSRDFIIAVDAIGAGTSFNPNEVEHIALLVPAARAGNIFQMVAKAMIELIQLDPAWNNGQYTSQPLVGLRAAGRMYFPWTVADAYLEQLTPQELEQELQGMAARAAAWDAWSFIRRYQASSSHDVSLPFGGDLAQALARVRASTLIMPTATDRLLGVRRRARSPGWCAMPRTPRCRAPGGISDGAR